MGPELIVTVVALALVVGWLFYKVVIEKGKGLSKKDKDELKNLKSGDAIIINDPRYDRKAEFRALIRNKYVHVMTFKDGVKSGLMVLPKSIFVCRYEEK